MVTLRHLCGLLGRQMARDGIAAARLWRPREADGVLHG
jgi:hypothetical protein